MPDVFAFVIDNLIFIIIPCVCFACLIPVVDVRKYVSGICFFFIPTPRFRA